MCAWRWWQPALPELRCVDNNTKARYHFGLGIESNPGCQTVLRIRGSPMGGLCCSQSRNGPKFPTSGRGRRGDLTVGHLSRANMPRFPRLLLSLFGTTSNFQHPTRCSETFVGSSGLCLAPFLGWPVGPMCKGHHRTMAFWLFITRPESVGSSHDSLSLSKKDTVATVHIREIQKIQGSQVISSRQLTSSQRHICTKKSHLLKTHIHHSQQSQWPGKSQGT